MFVRAAASADAFLAALAVACPELQIARDEADMTGEVLASEHRGLPIPGQVLSALGLLEEGEEVLCIDPSKSWWSEASVMERLSIRLGRVLCAMVDESFHAFGVRWYEDGRRVRGVLKLGPQLDMEGPTQREEVGVDMGRFDAAGARRVARLPAMQDLSKLGPLRVVVVRDPIAESLLR